MSADDDDEDDAVPKRNEEDDEDEIPVLTPRPHRNKFDKDMDTLIVENGENIERLRLPSLEEEDDEEDGDDEEEEEDDNTGTKINAKKKLQHLFTSIMK